MRSPFPGMDPYLESPKHWSDFHAHFVVEFAEAINQRLPDEYVARVDERVSMVIPVIDSPDPQYFIPDVSVLHSEQAEELKERSTGVATLPSLKPTLMMNVASVEPWTETYLRIVRLPEQRLVTVVELLSPTNKYGNGRGDYLQKRREFLQQPVNLVELDLHRAGRRIEFSKPLPSAHYFALVTRATRPDRTEAYHWNVRDPLPTIPIPLLSPERDVLVDLTAPFASAYERGRYWKLVNYKEPPKPSLRGPDAEWAAELGKAGARP